MKNVIITGTSRGIGFELAQLFAKKGYQILALSRNCEPIKKLNIKNITTLAIDISIESDLKKVTNFISDNWKTVDILINNAGKLINKPFKELSTSDFLETYKVNVFSVAELTRNLIPYFKEGSHVVNISSIGGVQGSLKFPGLAAYSSSKGALITLTELLAEEYKHKQISFNVLALGAVQTEMLQEAFPGYKAPVSAKEMAEFIYNFSINGHKFQNGKIVEVSSSTP
jgi:NAD(P)-dependent dehydrogenase (short-subunit alcohol dehydrogenase family)